MLFKYVNKDQNVGRNPLSLHLKLNKYYIGSINIESSVTQFAIMDIDESVMRHNLSWNNEGNYGVLFFRKEEYKNYYYNN